MLLQKLVLVRCLFCLSFAAGLMFTLRSHGGLVDDAEVGDYKNCRTLTEAVKIVRTQLVEDGKPEYAAILTESKVRAAILAAIKRRDQRIADNEESNADSKEFWQETIKPVCHRIVESGDWPANCSFTGFYGLSDKHWNKYDGVGIRLNIKTPKDTFEGYALPILDLYFGYGG